MKKLTLKEIVITIIVSYLITAYIQSEFNPINWSMASRIAQLIFIGLSLNIQLMIKQFPE